MKNRTTVLFLLGWLLFCPMLSAAGVVIIAHRGASGLAPENTMSAFAKAIEIGSEYFELDVYLSKDDSLMLMHDATVDRTTSGSGSVASMTYQQLRGLDAGSWFSAEFAGEMIPTLSEALDLAVAAPYPVGVVIEIKATTAGIVEKIIAEVQKRNLQKRVIISSFSLSLITQSKQIDPSIPVQLFATATQTHINQVDAIHGEWVGTGGAVTRALVDSTHARGMFLNKWTVNSGSDMATLISQGVDAITTNFPNIAKAIMDTTPPSDVVMLAPTVDGSRISLSWQPATDKESGILGYELYRDTLPGAVTLLRSLPDTTLYIDETLSESKTFYYRVRAKNSGGMISPNYSNEVSATTTSDRQPPRIREIHSYGLADQVIVAFDECLDQVSAETAANYRITPETAIVGARLSLDKQSVILSVAPLTEVTAYTLTVSNLKDIAAIPNQMPQPETKSFTYTPLMSNTVAYWNMEEGSGTALSDHSGNNNRGTIYGSPVWNGGRSGNGLIFDGINDYTTIPSSGSLNINTNAVSISVWVRLDYLPNDLPGSYGPIYDSNTDCYVLYEDRGVNELRFKVTTDKSAERPGIPASYLTTGEWLHIVGVYDGSRVRIYLNGQLRDSHNLSGTVKSGQQAAIGLASGCYFKGAIDELHIFNQALTTDEIQFLYTGQTPATSVQEPSEFKQQGRLSQNYPNPFNASTTLSYQLAEPGRVHLAVYDVLGRRISQLVDQVQPAGSHRITWNGTRQNGEPVGSGLYFYRLTTAQSDQTRRMILMK